MVIHPNSDVQTTGWVQSTGGTVFGTIDEVAFDDADYVTRRVDEHVILIVGLDATMVTGTQLVNLRLSTTDGIGLVRAHLLDGASVILGSSAWQEITTTPTTYPLLIPIIGTASRLGVELAPDNILVDENGDPILTESGDYIIV